MTWAGPLPDEMDPTGEAMWEGSMTFAGHWAAKSAAASPPSNGIDPIVWAGPLPAEAPVPPAGAVVRLRGSAAATMQAKVLGMLPVADPRLQTRGVLAELSGSQAQLAVGQMLGAQLPGSASPAAGVILARGALLREGSQVWAYVQTGPTTFVRREVTGFQPLTAGWFVSGGFAPGERVVTAGAAALLGVEAPAGGGD